jgi:hypothetical protein
MRTQSLTHTHTHTLTHTHTHTHSHAPHTQVRHVTLALTAEEGKRVRICVQQPLGEGIFVGLPLSLASMRPVLGEINILF